MAGKETEDPLLVRFRKMSKPVRVVYARPFEAEEKFFYQRKASQAVG